MTILSPPAQKPGKGQRKERPPRKKRQTQPRRVRAARPRMPRGLVSFVGAITVILTAALVALLLVNNSLAAGSFRQASMKAERTALFEKEQALRQEVLALSSPTNLRIEAAELGLVAAATTVFLDVETGRIQGIPRPATGGGLADGFDPQTGLPLAGTDPQAPLVPSPTDPQQPGEQGPTTGAPGADEGAPQPGTPGSTTPDSAAADDSGGSAATGDGASDGAAGASSDEAGTQPSGDGAQLGGMTARDRAILTGVEE